ncbi:MAG: dTDP-glucose 4,6-dehydratase [Terriglobia bacterium]
MARLRNLLVTGGAGFIGSNFIRLYLKNHPSAHVVNLDKLTYAGNLENVVEIESHPHYTFIRGDICDERLVDELLDHSVDAIVHFAAESHVDRSIADAREFIRTNVQGTLTLIEAARRKKIERFLHVSTDEVYGSMPEGKRAAEDAQVAPNSPYAASKAASDMIVRSYIQTHGFPALITRASNNYGPHQFPEKLIPLMLSLALEGKKLPVYGDGLNERDWIYVEDHCAALDAVLRDGRLGEVYNLGYGMPISNLEIVKRILSLLGKPESLIQFVKDRPGHDRRYALNTTKVELELGWKPAVTLDDGLTRTVAWYESHAAWIATAKKRQTASAIEERIEGRE